MTDQITPKLAPGYEQMVKEIGMHLQDRKGLFMKRVFFVALPGLLIIILSYFSDSFKTLYETDPFFVIPLLVLIFLFVIAQLILSNIFYLEQLIWVDSYHDGRNLDSKSSWRIARKLFFPSILFTIKLTIRYYLPALIIFILGSSIPIYYSSKTGNLDFVLLVPLVLLIALGIYFYYVNIKIRYAWFLFLDLYGQPSEDIYAEIRKLNDYAKSETFKKALIATLGTDSIKVLTQATISVLTSSAAVLGKFGGVAGALLGSYAQEAAQQLRNFSLIVVYYMLYRYAREGMYGKSQTVNEKIYELSK